MTNHLAHENSPYLLQHASNPVEWYPWGQEALDKARAEDKPIFLSIGYAACHWCHVMAHESFENPGIAAIMNKHFVNIKVDREERPDLDSIYMQAVVALTQQGGWPMSVFLTPDGRPFYGGTYFPPVRRYNMPSFSEVLQAIAQLWQSDRSRLLESSQELSEHLQQKPLLNAAGTGLSDENLKQAAAALAGSYDWTHGGWGRAPKFPQPMTIEFLLGRAARGDLYARDIAVHALHAMARGGMYDVVGGGFARYSVDDRWHTPHFEKMLYDNSQLALAYLHAYMLTAEPAFLRVCEETLDFILREMTHPEGGFYSSLDADSEGEEGKFYVWSLQEIKDAFAQPEDAEWIIAAYGVSQAGNFEGQNVLQRVLTDQQMAEKFAVPVSLVAPKLKELHAHLLEVRSRRARPSTDDKILVFWNAQALAAFAEAGRFLDRPDYLAAARRNARFLFDNLFQKGRLLRSWRNGQARHNAYLEDYAGLVCALLALYQSDFDPTWYQAALLAGDEIITHYSDPDGGFYDTRDDHETLLYRPKEIQDNAVPSGNALAASVLLQLADYGDRPAWRSIAEAMLAGVQDTMVRYPTAFAQWLCAADYAIGPSYEIAIVGSPADPQTQALVKALWKTYRPRQVTAVSAYPPAPGSPALLNDRPMLAGKPAAYVCQGFVCRQPVSTPKAMLEQLST